MRRTFITLCVALLPAAAAAQSHTIVALSHTDHTAYEIDPVTGQHLHTFKAAEQPHEGVASPDGRTYYAAIPNGPHVVVLDATTTMISNGPTGGSLADLKDTRTLIVGTDQVAVDAFGATLLGKTAADLPFIAKAEALGAGSADYRALSPIEVAA